MKTMILILMLTLTPFAMTGEDPTTNDQTVATLTAQALTEINSYSGGGDSDCAPLCDFRYSRAERACGGDASCVSVARADHMVCVFRCRLLSNFTTTTSFEELKAALLKAPSKAYAHGLAYQPLKTDPDWLQALSDESRAVWFHLAQVAKE